jgi:anthranilate synthase/aminodeoxychorismate synthase-like glutamine amidotransferase
MILLIDNYDSFVHNLARYLEELGRPTRVVRNRDITPEEVLRLKPRAVVISPGPCDPERAGVSVPLVRAVNGRLPVLGICLGHQAIAAALGGRVVRGTEPVHGMSSPIHHDGKAVFAGIPNPFRAGRYHSLVVSETSLPPELIVSATTPDGRGGRVVMALRHRQAPTVGLQFHPESVLTEHGHRLLSNFLRLADAFEGEVPAVEPAVPLHGEPPLDSAEQLQEEESARAASEGGAARAGIPRSPRPGPPGGGPPLPARRGDHGP